MKRKIILDGELGSRFGDEWDMEVTYPKDIFKCIECNYPEFRQYLIECHEKGIAFTFSVAGTEFSKEEQLLMNLAEGDIIISPVISGSKSGGAKILAAIAIVALLVFIPTLLPTVAGEVGSLGAVLAGTYGTGTAIAANVALGMAINLAITGIQQLMAPDPETDSDSDPSYLFNGKEQNIIEGDPIPILYGQLRIPGQPISASIVSRSRNGGSLNSAGRRSVGAFSGINGSGGSSEPGLIAQQV